MPPREYIELSGPIFDSDVADNIADAVGEGLRDLGELGAEILQGTIHAAGFINTGRFVSSVESIYRSRPGESGYALIRPDDAWPKPGRPTRSWFEKGTRRPHGKLRKGGGGFAKTRTRLKGAGLGDIEQRIVGVLS